MAIAKPPTRSVVESDPSNPQSLDALALSDLETQDEDTELDDLDYPDSDGKPMADNTLQFQNIVMVKENLEAWFGDDTNVFVAGDLLWYPVKGNPRLSAAPDVLVAFGRPKGYRGSYRQWMEDNVPPQVVFEILSPGNSVSEMTEKGIFYDRHGVQEYYIYDPDKITFETMLRSETDGNLSAKGSLIGSFTSPLLGVRFEASRKKVVMYLPNGERFKSFSEIKTERDLATQMAEEERQRAEKERQRANVAESRANVAESRAGEQQQRADVAERRAEEQEERVNAERLRADAERLRAEQLLAQLRAAGIDFAES